MCRNAKRGPCFIATAGTKIYFAAVTAVSKYDRKERWFRWRWVHSNFVYTVTYVRTRITVLHPLDKYNSSWRRTTWGSTNSMRPPLVGMSHLSVLCVPHYISAFFATCKCTPHTHLLQLTTRQRGRRAGRRRGGRGGNAPNVSLTL